LQEYRKIRETDDIASFSAQDPFAKRITPCYFFHTMNVTVYFDNEFCFRTVEVRNEPTDNHLTPDLVSTQPAVSHARPQHLLS
jgi:hypothetical protein